jgi:Zn-dependent M32 family carboxypeptidase
MRIHVPEHRSPLGITTREDDVRVRKLEDLKKEKNRKKAMSALVGEDHETANAPGDEMELVPSPLFSTMSGAHTNSTMSGAHTDSDEEEDEEYGNRVMVRVQWKEWQRVKRLNKELVAEMASAIGLESGNSEDWQAEHVLSTFRTLMKSMPNGKLKL